MKKIFFAAMIPAAMLLSCGDNKSDSEKANEDSTNMMADTTSAMSSMPDTKMSDNANNKPVTDKDIMDFVQNSANVGMMEIELGRYATDNAQSQRVKDFGNMMVTDHTAAANDLKSMATSNSIQFPATMDKEHQGHVDMLKNKKGAAFDKAYMDMMVNGHKETIDKYKKATGDLKDDSYKLYATKTLPVLQKHLDSAQAIKKGL